MNWKEIREKYPKAWTKMLEWKDYLQINEQEYSEYEGQIGWWYQATSVHSHLKLWRTYELPLFYPFFDENEIYVSVIPYLTMGDTKLRFQIFTMYHDDFGEFKTRPEAEEAAFEKAFEILEQKLS